MNRGARFEELRGAWSKQQQWKNLESGIWNLYCVLYTQCFRSYPHLDIWRRKKSARQESSHVPERYPWRTTDDDEKDRTFRNLLLDTRVVEPGNCRDSLLPVSGKRKSEHVELYRKIVAATSDSATGDNGGESRRRATSLCVADGGAAGGPDGECALDGRFHHRGTSEIRGSGNASLPRRDSHPWPTLLLLSRERSWNGRCRSVVPCKPKMSWP
jgi:hypothetical protein